MGFTIFAAAAIAAGVFYITLYKVIKGLDAFTSVAKGWRSEEPQREELMKSLGMISSGVSATLWIFAALIILALVLVAIFGVIMDFAGV